jgi:2-polyprenyl-6-hydroxyphenyl methylase / 3-demethylubiquinone-9 3-methyltransferase
MPRLRREMRLTGRAEETGTSMSAPSIDPKEIEKFSALAASWWDPNGPFKALHRINPVRLKFILERVQSARTPPPLAGEAATSAKAVGANPRAGAHPLPLAALGASPASRGGVQRRPLKGINAVDLGCGGGLASVPLARLGASVTGLDASEEAIGAARAYAAQAGLDIDYRVGTAEALAAEGARFNLVVALEIIEHVADVGAFLTAASTLVAPGGLLIISTINRTQKARALALFGAERILNWAPEGAHEFDKLVTPEEIRAGAPDLAWEAPAGISYNPLGEGWTLSRDVSVNYLMAASKLR